MKYIRINNFYNQFGQPDYKGLDLKQILAGSQLYPTGATYCVVATTQELSTLPTDVEEITTDQYNTEKANMQSANQQPSQNEVLAQIVANLTLQNADFQNQIQTLSQTVAQMQLN
ncbi:hypothetical protein [Clostridium sp.]|jgi:hypothetical protein|uniref:hypothetical protein n=1 Tax=Clostridium sp. TaxID=1506 RepID=UPI003A393213